MLKPAVFKNAAGGPPTLQGYHAPWLLVFVLGSEQNRLLLGSLGVYPAPESDARAGMHDEACSRWNDHIAMNFVVLGDLDGFLRGQVQCRLQFLGLESQEQAVD